MQEMQRQPVPGQVVVSECSFCVSFSQQAEGSSLGINPSDMPVDKRKAETRKIVTMLFLARRCMGGILKDRTILVNRKTW
jgi:hypothetical protein